MKVFKLDKKTGKKTFVEYPRKDMNKIEGLDKDIVFFLTDDDERPEYDSDIEELEYVEAVTDTPHPKYPSLKLGHGSWRVIKKELKPLEKKKELLKEELRELVIEMSIIVSAIKNIHDPLRKDSNKIPKEFQDFVESIQKVRNRVMNDIDSMETPESAAKYKVRTEEAEQLLTQLKSYL